MARPGHDHPVMGSFKWAAASVLAHLVGTCAGTHLCLAGQLGLADACAQPAGIAHPSCWAASAMGRAGTSLASCTEMYGSMTCKILCGSLCWPRSRRRPGGKVSHWALPYNWAAVAAGPPPDVSPVRAAELVQPELQGLPLSAQLKDVLYQRPAAKLPVFRKALAGLSADLEGLCEQDAGSHLTLAAAVTAAMCAHLRPGQEHMTALFIDKFLTELLVDGLDESLPPQRRIGLMVLRDEGDTDSTMTRRSDKGKSLRPDGQLRSLDGQRLLFKWEEKAAGVRLEEAVEDLRRETTRVIQKMPLPGLPFPPALYNHTAKSRCCHVHPAQQATGYQLQHGHFSLAMQSCSPKLCFCADCREDGSMVSPLLWRSALPPDSCSRWCTISVLRHRARECRPASASRSAAEPQPRKRPG